MRPLTCVLVLGFFATAALRAGEPVKMTDPKDSQILAGFLQNVPKAAAGLTPEYCKNMVAKEPESYTWIALPTLSVPLTAYRLTGDAKHLEAFVQAFENMRSAMTKGPGGNLDWFGVPHVGWQDPNDKARTIPVLVADFEAADMICQFAEALDGDAAAAAKYAKQRQEYLDLVQGMVDQWDAVGCFVDLGKGGAVYRQYRGLVEGQALLTQPNNKHSIVVHGLLALYRATGKDVYMRKAIQVGTRFKHCLGLKDGHYEWNYWDPAGEWDVLPSNRAKWRHWIGVEHKGGYYALSLSQAVALYQHGVVFDKTDIDRFLKTQLQKCWNGDANAPKWARVDGSVDPKYMEGEYITAALAPYSEKVASFLYTGERMEERIKNVKGDWQGGPVLGGWLKGKWLDLPPAQADPRPYLAFGKKFLQKKENQEFADSLRFEVTGGGYVPPRAPADMKPMPAEPKR